MSSAAKEPPDQASHLTLGAYKRDTLLGHTGIWGVMHVGESWYQCLEV